MMVYIFEVLLFEVVNKYKVKVEKEYQFHPRYKYKFDYAIPEFKIAFEIEGGIYIQGRHNNPIGYTEDCIKYDLATSLGWKVYRFTTEQVRKGAFMFPTTKKPRREFVSLSSFLEEVILRGMKDEGNS